MLKKTIALVIMDGFGLAPASSGNAITTAATPRLDELFAACPHTQIQASGLNVGLPDGQMGNSEVGHTNIGAGRVVYQDLPRISKAIEDGSFFENPAFTAAVDHCLAHGTALHLMGLLSDGGVHSHNTHTWAFLELARRRGLPKVYLHCFLDGRDVSPDSGLRFVGEAEARCRETGARIATVMGRYYAMDRDNRWDRVERAYAAIVLGEAPLDRDPAGAVARSYEKGVTDEFMEPVICLQGAELAPNDAVIFTNFRPDRAREITRALVDPDFSGFVRRSFFSLFYVCTTQYDAKMPNVRVAFGPETLANTFGAYISQKGLTQLRIAETEKYAHVTFFFNGGVETVYPGEDRVLVPSPKVATYDLQPEMSAYPVTDEVVSRIRSGAYDAVILNFANCDMVGHTGIFDAARRAVEAVDSCVGRVAEAVAAVGGVILITADHGNAEQMLEADGLSPFTAHTTNPVPLIVRGGGVTALREGGRLCDLTPTMLDLMGLPQPAEMTGRSLILR
ncbi:MAG: 2,3-bisphosphoglycerate-independent phosphoglycerate mutase [Oscillospiraceae bacterium]|jgi:2,3-bisphosphoglycerate-independent phosphoglycerate mutase|nr:2,3-bisphosphoglycerate-independent phosphoglycerate mutase [Oscillospiraceae bacterium]